MARELLGIGLGDLAGEEEVLPGEGTLEGEDREAGAVHGMGAHEALLVAIPRGAGVLLERGLPREHDLQAFLHEGIVLQDAGLDGGLRRERVEVRGDHGCHL